MTAGAPTLKMMFPAVLRRLACSLSLTGSDRSHRSDRAGRARRHCLTRPGGSAPGHAPGRGTQCAAENCSLSVDPPSAVVDACGLMADVTRSK